MSTTSSPTHRTHPSTSSISSTSHLLRAPSTSTPVITTPSHRIHPSTTTHTNSPSNPYHPLRSHSTTPTSAYLCNLNSHSSSNSISHSTSNSNSNSASNSASNSSSQPLTSRSASSFSTVHSDPFLHAEELDTTFHWIPSFYLEERHVGSERDPLERDPLERDPLERCSGLSFGCRGLKTPLSVYSGAEDVEGETEAERGSEREVQKEAKAARNAWRKLGKVVKESELEDGLKERFLAMRRMIRFIGVQLFPPSHVLSEDVRMDVQGILEDMVEFLDQVLEKLDMRIEAAKQAMGRIPTDDTEDKGLEVSIREWVGALESLHMPTGTEALIFRNLSILFSITVYTPFLQLHRLEPTHNTYSLDENLASTSSKLKKVEAGARKADAVVRETEKAFEERMVGDRRGKGHVVSVSAPVVSAAVIARGRQRENTV